MRPIPLKVPKHLQPLIKSQQTQHHQGTSIAERVKCCKNCITIIQVIAIMLLFVGGGVAVMYVLSLISSALSGPFDLLTQGFNGFKSAVGLGTSVVTDPIGSASDIGNGIGDVAGSLNPL
jgi:hypothetical protein